MTRYAFIFPGQGAQKVGMGKDFYQTYPQARAIFDQADEILGRPLSRIIFEGPEEELNQTKNSQVAIYVTSMAILSVLELEPTVCAGLSLGEYTAVTASRRLQFEECLPLVQARGNLMNHACEANKGAMAAIIGLDNDQVIKMAEPIDGLWVANLNCPKQVVISGTEEGVAKGIESAKELGARRAMPLTVHGAFHSGLMQQAESGLALEVAKAPLKNSDIGLVMNVRGGFVGEDEIRSLLVQQVTRSVRWEEGIRAMDVDCFIEIGPGKTLSGMNKRIGVEVPTINIECVEDLQKLEELACV